MDLREFVAESLKEIIDGVKEAQSHAAENGAEICPPIGILSSGARDYLESQATEEKVSFIDYDIAVTAEETGEIGGGGKVSVKVASVFSAEGGGEGKVSEKASSISRLHFSLPVVWPIQKKL